jgi:hypothetical protein
MLFLSIATSSAVAGDTYKHLITSGTEIWGTKAHTSAELANSFPAKMSAEEQGEKACKIYFETYFPHYHFFHRYLNEINPQCFCDTRVSANHGIDFIGIPKRGHSKKPLLIIEAKYSASGTLKLKPTKTKGVQMSKEWCFASLLELYKILTTQKTAISSKKKINKTLLECVNRSISVIQLLLHPDTEYIRLATVYNPKTSLIDLYTPIAIA